MTFWDIVMAVMVGEFGWAFVALVLRAIGKAGK